MRSLSIKEQKAIFYTSILSFCLAITPQAYAMHIIEGYLPIGHAIFWGVLCIPFLLLGIFRIRNIVRENRKSLLLLAMVGAYTFVLSALKIPSVTGSSSHPTGTGLGAVLFQAPSMMSLIGLIVLLFQALLLAHGGLTTLGANTFSMAIVGPFVSYGVYKLCNRIKCNRKVGIFLAAMLGDLTTYCVTSFQLALAYPSQSGGVLASMLKFMGIYAITQVPLALIEGLLTVIVILGLEAWAKPELKAIGYDGV